MLVFRFTSMYEHFQRILSLRSQSLSFMFASRHFFIMCTLLCSLPKINSNLIDFFKGQMTFQISSTPTYVWNYGSFWNLELWVLNAEYGKLLITLSTFAWKIEYVMSLWVKSLSFEFSVVYSYLELNLSLFKIFDASLQVIHSCPDMEIKRKTMVATNLCAYQYFTTPQT